MKSRIVPLPLQGDGGPGMMGASWYDIPNNASAAVLDTASLVCVNESDSAENSSETPTIVRVYLNVSGCGEKVKIYINLSRFIYFAQMRFTVKP